MGPWGGVLYPLGMRVSPTRPHLGLCPLMPHLRGYGIHAIAIFPLPAFPISVACWFPQLPKTHLVSHLSDRLGTDWPCLPA